MTSLLLSETKQEFINRINKLTPETKAVWGTMSVDQMLKHCQIALEIAVNKRNIKPNKLITFLFGKRILKKITSPGKFDKNLPTFKEAKLPETKGFDFEKQALLNLIPTFEKQNITQNPHPAFGQMTHEQWDISHVKHLDHHLNQFGV